VSVYLDVSGSMNEELKAIVALLHRFESHLRRPFYAFSDCVEPATFRHGRLVTKTTGGTTLACVIEHLRQTRPLKALIITDGFVESLRPEACATPGTTVEVLVTAKGSTNRLPPAWRSHRLVDLKT
jgi:predicted metal-dependent peptidase